VARASYAELGDACATAHAMELIGNRWSYPILRELMLGPKRFNELFAAVRGITPAVLTARLRELTETGLVQTTVLRDGAHQYAVTPWAAELREILRGLGRWALASPVRTPTGGLTADAAVQAMPSMASPPPAAAPGHLQLYLRDERISSLEHPYRVWWDESRLAAERGTDPDEQVTQVRCDSSTWGRILLGAPVRGNAEVTGDRTPLDALLDWFTERPAGSAAAP